MEDRLMEDRLVLQEEIDPCIGHLEEQTLKRDEESTDMYWTLVCMLGLLGPILKSRGG